ncbi:MAG: hypothetical protein ACYDH9_04745 [Limisphaerales bacterium]
MKEAYLVLFGSLVGFLLARLQSALDLKVDGRNAFRECISDLHAKLDSSDVHEECFFEDSVPVLHREVRRVLRFVGAKRKACLRQAMKDYESHHKSEFAGARTRQVAAIATGKSHKERLHELLDGFEECIHKST